MGGFYLARRQGRLAGVLEYINVYAVVQMIVRILNKMLDMAFHVC